MYLFARVLTQFAIALIRVSIWIYGCGYVHVSLKAPLDMRFHKWEE